MASSRVRWGQNFLIDAEVAERIVDWAAVDGKTVVEIGPGRGALTEMLAERAARLLLIEIDSGLAERWSRRFEGHASVEVICGDALRTDLPALAGEPFSMVSNLPYESGTAIVTSLLREPGELREMVVMVQREVAERLAASEGSKTYGLLSVMTTLEADVSPGLVVAPEAFRPPPKVWSQVVRIRPLSQPRYEVGEKRVFRELVTVAFAGRRKMLRNTLGRRMQAEIGADAVAEIFAAAGVSLDQRPEQISVQAFACIASSFCDLRAGGGPHEE